MITEETVLQHPRSPRPMALQLAAELYHEWQGMDLLADMSEYALAGGVVIVRPDLFGIARLIEFQGRPAWFIRMAVGRLSRLLEALPSTKGIETICFCRHTKSGQLDGRIRGYPLARMRQLTKLKEI